MKTLHSRRGGKRTSINAIALSAVAGCILFFAVFATDSPYLVTSAHAEQKKPCKKTVISLQEGHLEAEGAFQEACGKCHVPPDPSKPSCSSGLGKEDLTAIWNYMHKAKTMGTAGLDCLESEGKEAYENHCSRCHKLPDPAKPNCLSETPLQNLIKAHTFMEKVRKGKDLYGKRCNSCHASIEPSEHSYDFWRRHLCAEAAGLEKDEAQKVLLYLKAAGKKQ